MKPPTRAGLLVVAGTVGIAALVLGAHAFTTDSPEKAPALASYRQPHAETTCRAPDPATEFRVWIEWCNAPADCYRSCSIEPRKRDEGRGATIKRLLGRIKT